MQPVITKTDYNTLKSTILQLPPVYKTKEVRQLIEELEKGSIIKDNEITSDVIQLNSYFEAVEENSKQVLKFFLTLPTHANLKEKKISVLSPLGIALIGFKEGMTVDCVLPAGNKKLKIIKVVT